MVLCSTHAARAATLEEAIEDRPPPPVIFLLTRACELRNWLRDFSLCRVAERIPVDREKRGTKRTCPSCGNRFYDMRRVPIVCPGCGSSFSPEDFMKPRRVRPMAAAVAAAKPSPVVAAGVMPVAKEPIVEEVIETAADLEEVEAEEEETFIEDASELGEDEDDVAEVMENVAELEETDEP